VSGLGKMYGIASRTIGQQRDEIQRLRLAISAARIKCTCRAWWDVCDELKDEGQLRKELDRTRQKLRAARTFRTTEQENPRCECNHLWSDHADGGICGYTWDAWDSTTSRTYKRHCQYAHGKDNNGICQHFRPWNPQYRRAS
jgi:hypothetical protein